MFTKAYNSANAPQAIGPYSPALKLGDFVYLSGQLPIDPQSGALVSEDIQAQTYQVLKNLEAVLAEMNLETHRILDGSGRFRGDERNLRDLFRPTLPGQSLRAGQRLIERRESRNRRVRDRYLGLRTASRAESVRMRRRRLRRRLRRGMRLRRRKLRRM
jgi:hypothetical protein